MIFGSRKVNELYQRYCRQVLKILRSPSYDLTGEELRKLKSEEERQSWILTVVKRKLEERKSKDKSHRL